MLESIHFFLYDFLLFFPHWIRSYKEWCFVFQFQMYFYEWTSTISLLRLNTSINCSTFIKNSSFSFSFNIESLRLSFIQSISLSVIFLLTSSGSNQGYLSSGVDLFVSSIGSSIQVVIHGISVGWIGF